MTLGPQFIRPDIGTVEEKYTKQWFQDRGRNTKRYLDEHGVGMLIDSDLGNDLISNRIAPMAYEDIMNNPKVEISKIFHFAAAHYLPYHVGKCQYLHGHEWKLEICVRRAINEEGMVIDYSDLKKIVKYHILDQFDHSFLNALIPNPTAENLLIAIWNILQYDANLKGICAIRIWEAPESCAVLTAKDMSDHVRSMWEWK